MPKKIIPNKIRLEASSACQLKCPSCPTTTKAIQPTVGTGFLTIKNFRTLLDKNPGIEEIELSNYGEIFLNPDLLEIIKYAFQRKVRLTAENGVNLNYIKMDVLEGLVQYQFRSMMCSIDGASADTYKQYRIGGNFETVINNIKKINLFKKQYDSQYPLLTWQFVIFGYNEHEIQLAENLASELHMKFQLKLSWDPEFSPVRNIEFIREKAGAASRAEYKETFGVPYFQKICHQLWDQPQINWDGKLLGCCRNFWGDFGSNVLVKGLEKSLNNEKMHYARNMLLGKEVARDDIPCTTCENYIDMAKAGKWLARGPQVSRKNPWWNFFNFTWAGQLFKKFW